MKKDIKVINEEKGIIQITTTDERWYSKESRDKKTGLPKFDFVPSVTWICSFYPKGTPFYKWLAEHGWDESIALRDAAGARGSKVHNAIEQLINGEEVSIESKFLNTVTGNFEELEPDEYEAVISFITWYEDAKPDITECEIGVWNDKEGYAGTVDIIANIKDKKTGKVDTWIIDIKTGQNSYKEHQLQISSYKHALGLKDARLAILQVGYRRNKNKFKFTEYQDCFDLFLVAKQLWAVENKDKMPLQRDFPVKVELPKIQKEESKPKKKKDVE